MDLHKKITARAYKDVYPGESYYKKIADTYHSYLVPNNPESPEYFLYEVVFDKTKSTILDIIRKSSLGVHFAVLEDKQDLSTAKGLIQELNALIKNGTYSPIIFI